MAHIAIAMLLGVLLGELCHRISSTQHQAATIAGYFSLVTSVFLRLIKMIIAPLVFSTLASGVAGIDSRISLGRLGTRTLVWFVVAGLASLSLGLFMADILHPGRGLLLSSSRIMLPAKAEQSDLSLETIITHIIPSSFFQAMADNEILQVVVFALFTGVALNALGERGFLLSRALDALAALMLKITEYVIRVAPIAVVAALAAIVTTRGLSILLIYGPFLGSFYLALLILWVLLSGAAFLVLGRDFTLLLKAIKEPVLLAFATASSEAAFAKTLEQLQRIGIPKQVASFVIPLGFSFNTDGAMMYCALSVMFLAQAYGIALTIGQQAMMLLLLMVASKGVAAVPRASLMVVAAVLPQLHIPTEGVAVLLAVDQLLDMGRSATNIVGNSVAAAVMAKWEDYDLHLSDNRAFAERL
jgi:Na+/H+-dicarboxylate symporter